MTLHMNDENLLPDDTLLLKGYSQHAGIAMALDLELTFSVLTFNDISFDTSK